MPTPPTDKMPAYREGELVVDPAIEAPPKQVPGSDEPVPPPPRHRGWVWLDTTEPLIWHGLSDGHKLDGQRLPRLELKATSSGWTARASLGVDDVMAEGMDDGPEFAEAIAEALGAVLERRNEARYRVADG